MNADFKSKTKNQGKIEIRAEVRRKTKNGKPKPFANV
jgi:hypothetical protein